MILSERIKSIEQKVHQLALQLAQLKHDNASLSETNGQLLTQLLAKDAKIRDLEDALQDAEQHQLNIQKLSKEFI